MENMEIPGLSIVCDAIDVELETIIIKEIEKRKWTPLVKFREVQQYGYAYDYQKKKTGIYTDIPQWLTLLADYLQLPKPENIIINKYDPGEGIADHIDSNYFGPIVASLSLKSPITMEFKLNSIIKEYRLEPCSLLRLEGEARENWTHGIVPRKADNDQLRQTRYSITFRTLA